MGLLGLDDGLPPKPKGMHWHTYRRLEQLDEHLADRWVRRYGRLPPAPRAQN